MARLMWDLEKGAAARRRDGTTPHESQKLAQKDTVTSAAKS